MIERSAWMGFPLGLPLTPTVSPQALNRVRGRHGAAGFTLIEVLVALVIFVAGYVVVYQSVSLAWRGTHVAWAETAAVRLAQSRLDAAGIETALAPGERSGTTADGLRWTVRTEPYRSPGGGLEALRTQGASSLAAYWVTVTVTWDGGVLRGRRSLRLKTIKLADRQADRRGRRR